MKYDTTVIEDSAYKVVFDVVVPSDEVEHLYNNILKEFSKDVKLKGFRKGKVKPFVVQQYYHKLILKDTLNRLIHDTIHNLTEGENARLNLKDIDKYQIVLNPYKKEQPFSFSLIFLKYPDIDMEKYLGIEVEIDVDLDVTEEEVEKEIHRRLETLTDLEEKEGPAEDGDVIRVRYSRYEEGNEEPILKDFETDIPLTEDKILIEGLREQLVGATKGKTFDITGKSVVGKDDKTYRIVGEVLGVYKIVTPKLTDETAKKLGAESVDDLKNKIKEQLIEAREEIQKEAIWKLIFDKLLEDYPPQIEDEEIKKVLGRIFYKRMIYYPYSEEVVQNFKNYMWETTLLRAIARKEDIKVDKDDIENYIRKELAKGEDYKSILDKIQNSPYYVNDEITIDKARDLLVRYAKVKVVKKEDSESEKTSEEQSEDNAQEEEK